MNKKKLQEILEKHKKWLNNEECGVRANLSRADLCGANLWEANLWEANLCGANLWEANLSRADLGEANLRRADLRGANLWEANLWEANLWEANLCGAKNIPYIPLVCPEDGSFIGFKKVQDKIIKLEIPAEAKRSSATTRKCRCEYAKVLSISNLDGSEENATDGSIVNEKYSPITYTVGEMVYPDSFDEDRWNECSNGIHFFINRQEAVEY